MATVTARHRAEAMAQVMATHDAPGPDLSVATSAMLRTCAGYLAQFNADAEVQREYRESRRPVAVMGFQREARTGLIHLGEAA